MFDLPGENIFVSQDFGVVTQKLTLLKEVEKDNFAIMSDFAGHGV